MYILQTRFIAAKCYLPLQFKDKYCTMLYYKDKQVSAESSLLPIISPPTHDELNMLRARLSATYGDLRIQCVKLICVGYYADLVQDLCSGRRVSTRETRPTWKRKVNGLVVSPSKRARLAS